jgi:hypothetical protein
VNSQLFVSLCILKATNAAKLKKERSTALEQTRLNSKEEKKFFSVGFS